MFQERAGGNAGQQIVHVRLAPRRVRQVVQVKLAPDLPQFLQVTDDTEHQIRLRVEFPWPLAREGEGRVNAL